MDKKEVIQKLEDIQWKIRHNIDCGIKEIDENIYNEEYEEFIMNLIKDKLHYLEDTDISVEELFLEDELSLFNIK